MSPAPRAVFQNVWRCVPGRRAGQSVTHLGRPGLRGAGGGTGSPHPQDLPTAVPAPGKATGKPAFLSLIPSGPSGPSQPLPPRSDGRTGWPRLLTWQQSLRSRSGSLLSDRPQHPDSEAKLLGFEAQGQVAGVPADRAHWACPVASARTARPLRAGPCLSATTAPYEVTQERRRGPRSPHAEPCVPPSRGPASRWASPADLQPRPRGGEETGSGVRQAGLGSGSCGAELGGATQQVSSSAQRRHSSLPR